MHASDKSMAEYRQARESGVYQDYGWTEAEYNEFTHRLRVATEKYWPELWRSMENENTPAVERAWAIVSKMCRYLRLFWGAEKDKRARDWYIHRAREYHERLRILPELLQLPESDRVQTAELKLDNPPASNPIEKALYELQKRAEKPMYAPRVCKGDDCERKYFLSTQKGQEYCPDCRRADRRLQRKRRSNLKSYHDNKKTWPSTANRRKNVARKRNGLYRRKNIYGFRYKDAAGIWREKLTGTRDREEAKRFRKDFLEHVDNGTLPTDMAEWTLEQAKDWWIDFRKPRVAVSTLTPETYRLKPMIGIHGNIRLKQITNVALDNYVTQRLAEEIAPWSINKEILAWSLILKKARLWRRLAGRLQAPTVKASDIGRALTRNELRHLAEVAATEQDWEAAFYGSVLAANTGLRGGEIKKLKIGALDLEHRRLVIRRADTKSDAGARTIELNREATEAAIRLILRASLLEPPSTKPEHYLMPKHLSRIAHGAHKGERGYDVHQHQQYWDTAWRSLTEKAGFPGLRFHDLRHTFISMLVEKGVPLGVIQTFVGHMSARMVRHYTHISSGAARKAVELLDADPILVPVAEEEEKGKVHYA